MFKNGIKFHISRIRHVSVPDMIHKVTTAFFVIKTRRLVKTRGLSLEVPDVSKCDVEALQLPEMEFSVNNIYVQEIMQWRQPTRDDEGSIFKSFERVWRNTFHSDIKPDDSTDIKSVWKSARLQHISYLLACANGLDGTYQEAAKAAAKDMILDWLDSNPFLFGLHYMSTTECGLRIQVFVYCIKSIENLTTSEHQRLLTGIYGHAWWVSHLLSQYSSFGSSTIAEAVGLVFAGIVFKNTWEGKEWLGKGCNLLEQGLVHQILDDGGPAEQSFEYHRFILDLYWLALNFLEKNDIGDYSAWASRLKAGEKFLKAFADKSGKFPSIGGSDDGYAIAPGIHPKRILDDFAESRPRVTFPVSGYTVIHGANGLLLAFDHGPLGLAPLYERGHADALSVTLSVAGEQILVDPGTNQYNGAQEWRKYFKGTKAHNTVMVDGQDQAVMEADFSWRNPYNVTLTQASEDGDNHYIDAYHDGYTRLRGPVIHRRIVDFCSDSLFFIKDTFSGKGLHKFQLNFHLHPDTTLLWKDRYSVIKKGEAELTISLLGGKKFRTACGETTPPFGWYSSAYGVKVQTPVLSCEVVGQPDEVSFITAVSLGRAVPDVEGLEKMASHP